MAESGWGSEYAFEADPVGDPGTFTPIAEFSSDFVEKFTRDMHEHRTHQRVIAGAVPGQLKLEPWTVNFGYEVNDSTHIALKAKMLSGERFKSRFRGPGGGPDQDEYIASGFLTSWQATDPVNGLRSGELIFQPDGDFLRVDGVNIVS